MVPIQTTNTKIMQMGTSTVNTISGKSLPKTRQMGINPTDRPAVETTQTRETIRPMPTTFFKTNSPLQRVIQCLR